MVEDIPSAFPDEALLDDDRKRRKKHAKLLLESTRSPDAWERYRTLVDAHEEANDLVERDDLKARFAIKNKGALNVAF